MRPGLICATLLFALAVFLFPVPTAHAAATGDITIEAQLIWGTNEKPDPKLKAAEPNLAAKFKKSPFKWDHYCEMHREKLKLKLNEEKTVTMSPNCVISITNLGDEQVKFKLFGKGKLANTVSQALPKGQLLITGGDAENSTAWFVVLQQVE